VLVGEQEFKLRSGEHVIISDDASANFKQANPVPRIAVRGQVEHKLANGMCALVSEFSLPSAMTEINTLSSLPQSSSAHQRALYEKMLKNAAVLQMVTGRKGPYKAVNQ
jgi:hypothetical protein